MEEQVLKQVEEATNRHNDHVSTITDALPLLPDISSLVLSYLMSANINYWLEEKLLMLGKDQFSRLMKIESAIDRLKGSNTTLKHFEAEAKHWHRNKFNDEDFRIRICVAWDIPCCRVRCYWGSEGCICDDPLTYDVLRHRVESNR